MSEPLEWTNSGGTEWKAVGNHDRRYFISRHGASAWKVWLAVPPEVARGLSVTIARGFTRTLDEAKQAGNEWEQAFRKYEPPGAGMFGGAEQFLREKEEERESPGEGDL